MTNNQKVTRKLRAILSADVKGYSLLMADDEVHTIQTLKAYRQIMSDLIDHHSGRVVDNPGDNLLAEFGGAVDAIKCAVNIQKKLGKENARYVEDRRLQFRIGINIGDVVQDSNRIYGEGVNIAARIESLADAGGICISRNTYDQVKSKLDLYFEYLGEHKVKNIKEPVWVYKVLIGTDSPKHLVEGPLELPDKPSIAVLPFDNLSGDPDQEYFSDGISEDIITALSRSPMLFVIARNSSFTYRGSSVDVRKVSRELGVRYILEGSVRKAGNHLRVTAQLIDGTTGRHIWADKYDGELKDIFELQDSITKQVVASIQPQIYLYEGDKNIKVDRQDVATWEVIARAWKLYNEYTKEGFISAEKLLRKTLSSKPRSCEVNFLLSAILAWKVMYRYSSDLREDTKEALSLAKRAVYLNSNSDYAHVFLGCSQYLSDRRELAIAECKRAIEINPNNSLAITFLCTCLSTKDPDESIKYGELAIRINPRDPSSFVRYTSLAWAYFMKSEYSESINWSRKSIQMNPYWAQPHIYLITCLAKLNKLEEAEEAVEYYLEYYPNDTISKIKKFFSFDSKEGFDQVYKALSKAGLPE
jgi:adenylate cyclase